MRSPFAFSVEERDPCGNGEAARIIEAFKGDRYYRYYAAPLIEFLFLTGCRPSEAVALQWKYLPEDCRLIRFERQWWFLKKGWFARKG